MAFRDLYYVENGSIVEHRGTYRDKPYTVIVYTGTPVQVYDVYKLMELVYNRGEHDGRKSIRNAVKEALDIEL